MNIFPQIAIIGLWLIISCATALSNIDLLNDATPSDRMIALFILIVFAPIFMLNNILQDILDILLDNHDDNGKGEIL